MGGVLIPRRIQLSRRKGWRIADHVRDNGYVIVDRRSTLGNPFIVRRRGTEWMVLLDGPLGITRMSYHPTKNEATVEAVRLHRLYIESDDRIPLGKLSGKDLACWCALEDSEGRRPPCHCDSLLILANPEIVFPWNV